MAVNPYVNKVVFGDQTVMDISDTTAEESDVVSGKTFYKSSGAKGVGSAVIPDISKCYQTTDSSETDIQDGDYFPFLDSSASEKKKTLWSNIKAKLRTYFDTLYATYAQSDSLVKTTVGWSAKNFLDCDVASGSQTKNGVTFDVTKNSEGHVTSIKVDGTATALTVLRIASIVSDTDDNVLTENTYILNGCPSGGSSSTYGLLIEGDYGASYADYGSGVFLTNGVRNGSAFIVIAKNYTASNLYFYPMLRNKSVIDTTFEPYRDSVDYVKANREEVADVVGWGGKNLAKSYFITTNTSSGSNAMFVEGDLEPDTEYILSFDTTNVYKFYINTNIVANGEAIGITTASGTNEMRFVTASVLSRSDSRQYNSSYGWRVLINNMAQSSTVSLTNIMLRKATIADPTYEPYHPSVKQTLRNAEVIEGRQKLIYPYYDTSKVLNGLTFTDNGDNSISVVGSTPSYDTFFIFQDRRESKKIKAGKYTLSIDNYPPTSYLYVDAYNGNTWVKTLITLSSSTKSGTFDIDYIGYDGIQIYAKILQNTTISSAITIKPMLCLADEEDKTFTSYYIPLKDSKFDRAEQRVLGAKNFLDKTIATPGTADVVVTQTENGVRGVVSNASTWKPIAIKSIKVPKNTDFILSDYANITSGYALQKISGSTDKTNWTTIKEDNPTIVSGNQVTKFNTGNYTYLKVDLYITGSSDKNTGDITYENIMLRLASDPDDTYVPYAMTNKELTDAVQSGSGHTMIDNSTYISSLTAKSADDTDDDVASGYAVSNWSNADIMTIVATMSAGDDSVGTWETEQDWTRAGAPRTGWIWHKDLYHILQDNNVEIEILFDIKESEVVNLYAYRVDDEVVNNGVNGGAIAIKTNGAVKAAHLDVAVNLKRQRTNKVNATIL